MSEESDSLEYTQRLVYEDSTATPISLDLFSACALGSYECVQEAINAGKDFNINNKGEGRGREGNRCSSHFSVCGSTDFDVLALERDGGSNYKATYWMPLALCCPCL